MIFHIFQHKNPDIREKDKKGRKCKKEEKATISKRCLKVKSRFMLPTNTLVTGLVNSFCANIMVRPASNINSYTVRSLSKHNDSLILYKNIYFNIKHAEL